MKNLNFVNPQFTKNSEEQKIKIIRGLHDQLKSKIDSDILARFAKEADKALKEEQEDPYNRNFSYNIQKELIERRDSILKVADQRIK